MYYGTGKCWRHIHTTRTKKLFWAAMHIIDMRDKQWTARVKVAIQNLQKCGQITRWREEIGAYAESGWNTRTSEREVEDVGEGLCRAVDYKWLIAMIDEIMICRA